MKLALNLLALSALGVANAANVLSSSSPEVAAILAAEESHQRRRLNKNNKLKPAEPQQQQLSLRGSGERELVEAMEPCKGEVTCTEAGAMCAKTNKPFKPGSGTFNGVGFTWTTNDENKIMSFEIDECYKVIRATGKSSTVLGPEHDYNARTGDMHSPAINHNTGYPKDLSHVNFCFIRDEAEDYCKLDNKDDDGESDGSITGEPHLTLFGGEKFDWHGICDMVMVHAPKFADHQGLKIHVRTSEMQGVFSYVSTGVVQIGATTLELNEDGTYYWNGQANVDLPSSWPGIDGSSFYQATNPWDKKGKLIKMENGAGGVLTLELWHGIVSIFLDGFDKSEMEGATGLMGHHGHDHRKKGRRGQKIHDNDEFGREWQVRPALDGDLFRDEGADACRIAGSESSRRHLLQNSAIPSHVAKAACSGSTVVQRGMVDECMFDVQAMQAIDWALSFYYHLKDHLVDEDAINEVHAAEACFAAEHFDQAKFLQCHEAVLKAQSRQAAAPFLP